MPKALPVPVWLPGDVVVRIPWPHAKPFVHIIQHIDGRDTVKNRNTVFRASPERGPSQDELTADWNAHRLSWVLAAGGRLVPTHLRCINGALCEVNHLPLSDDLLTPEGTWSRYRFNPSSEVHGSMLKRGEL